MKCPIFITACASLLTINQFWKCQVSGSADCSKKQLVWNRIDSAAGSNWFQIQICCNVTHLTAWKLSNRDWKLENSPVFDNIPVKNLSVSYNEFVLSHCGQGKYEPGIVDKGREGTVCQHFRGDIIRVEDKSRQTQYGNIYGNGDYYDIYDVSNVYPDSTSNNRQHAVSYIGFSNNAWYVWCYKFRNGCNQCVLKRFCSTSYHVECQKVWMDVAVSRVTNDSVTINVVIGENMPFPDATLDVTVYQSNMDGTKEAVFKDDTDNALPKSKKTLEVDNLTPSTWYSVKGCIHFEIPDHFLRSMGNMLSKSQKHCVEDGSFRMHSSSDASPRSFGVILLVCLCLFVVMLR